jgi:magnesium transporter
LPARSQLAAHTHRLAGSFNLFSRTRDRYHSAMLHAFARYADGATACLTSFAGIAETWAIQHSVTWVDLVGPTESDLRQLSQIIPLDSGALDDCLHGEQRPRVDEFDDYIFLVLYGLRGTATEADEINPRKLAAFCGRRFLITVHERDLPSVNEVRERASRYPAHILAGGVDEVLYRIVDRMVDRYIEAVDRYEDKIEHLEERSLARDIDRALPSDTSDLRRQLLEIRHLAVAQRELIRPLANGDLDYIGPDLALRFRHVADHLAQVIESIDGLREQLAAVRENHHAAIATRTNEIMKLLTIFATIMLPLTFVAGIYGMNLPLWPPSDDPASFWSVLGVMLLIAAGLLLVFRRKHWI